MLLHNGEVAQETRRLYFYTAFNLPVAETRIFSFGSCNFECPYCKRMDTFRLPDGSVIDTKSLELNEIFELCDDAMNKSQVVRLSGGDPVMFPKASEAIAHYVIEKGGRFSMAHNGSSLPLAKKLSPYLETAAIDIKAARLKMGPVIGFNESMGKSSYDRCLQVIEYLISENVLVDVRTPIFQDTTLDDLMSIASDIDSLKRPDKLFWTMRVYKPVDWCNTLQPPGQENVIKMAQIIKDAFPNIKIGMRAKWEPKGFLFIEANKQSIQI